MLQSLLTKLLTLGFFLMILTPGEAVVYYVTPIEPPYSDCPNQPCHTLDYYSCNGETLFNSEKVNGTVTIILMQGNHTLQSCSLHVEHLEACEMVGIGSAHHVIVHAFQSISFVDTIAVYIGKLTFIGDRSGSLPTLYFANSRTQTYLSLKQPYDPHYRLMFITINGTLTKGMFIHTNQDLPNFNIVLANSVITNGSKLHFYPPIDLNGVKKDFIRQLRVTGCTVRGANFHILYASANVVIEDSTVVDMLPMGAQSGIHVFYSNASIIGNIIFSNVTNGADPIAFIDFIACNVKVSGHVLFSNNKVTSIISYFSMITVSGSVNFFNNIGINGGAMALHSSTLNIDGNTSMYFHNNTATDTGGGIYVAKTIIKDMYTRYHIQTQCFYQLLNYTNHSWYRIVFHSNRAKNGGDHIYGEFMHSYFCTATEPVYDFNSPILRRLTSYEIQQKYFIYEPNISLSLSAVSSNPTRVCVCDNNNRPQANNVIYAKVHPGEAFSLPFVIVGADLGTTLGSIHAIFNHQKSIIPKYQYVQWINGTSCSNVSYTLSSRNLYEIIYLTVTEVSSATAESEFVTAFSEVQNNHYNIEQRGNLAILYTLLLLNITLLPCPPGFTLIGYPPRCKCHPVLKNKVSCQIVTGKGYLSWAGPMWLDIIESKIYLTEYCPFDYCFTGEKSINFQDDSSPQCLHSRSNRLCGGCRENYSQPIGSSRCIYCPNKNKVALLIFFAAAGFLLVLFISIFNLTVTQGMINGLIFYANIARTYQSILLPQDESRSFPLLFLRIFVAWLNLDFGIEVCFVNGLNTYWKTWLQYIFPFYIWSITGIIIVGARHSTKLTKLIGKRAVSVLATLFLLSYIKLLQTIIASMGFTPLKVFSINNDNLSYSLHVWSLDGNYLYCRFPHIFLFVAAVLVFTLLWLPYTLMLFSMQWMRRKSHFKVLNWIPKFDPFYNVHFGPLKDEHHYWFGVLLIVRATLLVIFTSTFTVYPSINYILLLIVTNLLLCYSNYHRVYKKQTVQMNENFFLVLLVLVGGSGVLKESVQHAVVYASIAMAFFCFCGFIAWNVVTEICNRVKLLPRQIKRKFIPLEGSLQSSNNVEPLLNVNTTIIQLPSDQETSI